MATQSGSAPTGRPSRSSACSRSRVAGLDQRAAADRRTAAGQRADRRFRRAAVAVDDRDGVRVGAQPVGDDLLDCGRPALALGGRAGCGGNRAVGAERQARGLPAEAGRLDIGDSRAAAQPAVIRRLPRCQQGGGPVVGGGVIAAVQGLAGRRRPRHVAGGHEIPAAHVFRRQIERVGEPLDQQFHGERGFRPAGAAIDADGGAVRLDAGRFDIDGRDLVGTGQDAPGVARRHDRAVGHPVAERRADRGVEME